jgi:multicomponent Na+:H+ antiporter subunit D
LLEHAAIDVGHGWIIVVFVIASILTAAAVLRAGGRIFLGWGEPVAEDPVPFGDPGGGAVQRDDGEVEAETTGARGTTPPVMIATAGALVAGGLAVGLSPALLDHTLDAAERFTDRVAYAAAVLHGVTLPLPDAPTVGIDALGIVLGLLSAGAAVGIALAVLSPRRHLRALVPASLREPTRRGYWALRRLHSGQIGDYVTWLSVGAATFGVLLAAATR